MLYAVFFAETKDLFLVSSLLMTAPQFISEPVAASVGTVMIGRAWVGIIQFS